MILVNPFWSVTQVVSSVLPWIVDMFRNGSKIGAIDIPTMIISSEADEVIPAVHREWLHDKCKNSHIVKLPGARHNDACGNFRLHFR
jgi:pimeloyl-ACP methyl ester carboxylesterase